MAHLDTGTLAQHAVSLSLVTAAQLRECQQEPGIDPADAGDLFRTMERKGYITPWQTNKLIKGDQDGFYLGGYRLLYRIAAGSFGRVFRADDPHTGQVVAIKVLRRRFSDNQHQVDLFEREGRVGMSLRHPNIVQILAVGRDTPTLQYYIVMEFVEGGNLRDFLTIRKKLKAAEALQLLEDTVAGLTYAYSKGVTHRDIKLTNILISAQGSAKLVDFGLAGIYAAASAEEDEQVERTVDYAGLERATNVPPGDIRSDIYFLGCVFYEMLTGRPPLTKTRDKRARMLKQRFERVPPIRPYEVEAPPAVLRLVEKMMSLNPRERYQTPSQLLNAIRDARRGLDGQAPGTPAERSVFVIEKDPRFQDALRSRFKEMGYRVYLSADPRNALNRFRDQPYDALVVNADTTGEDGLSMFRRIMMEADRTKTPCAGIIILPHDQSDLGDKLIKFPRAAAMPRPVTLKAVCRKLRELVPLP